VIGRGWTQPGGRPHAETQALARAGAAARDATAYVTLEPCNHDGETAPCSEALIGAGIGRAVVAIEDPDPRVAGSGIRRLEAAGIPVTLGIASGEARDLNAGFLMRIASGRPLVTLKAAITLDGRIATADGESRWITGDEARAHAHHLRAEHDAIVIGSGTALADDPRLTCRLPGLEERSPLRVILDGRMRLPLAAQVVKTARQMPTWLVTREDGEVERQTAYRDKGVEVIEAPAGKSDGVDLGWTLKALAQRGLTRVLVEGGGRLAAALLRLDLVDRLACFRAPRMMGGDGVPMAAGLDVGELSCIPRFVRTELLVLGTDLLETYRREE
ncbi:MAG: bifunctional diaminohydroxyphosphoribosylaminopyrimidine deaminase/5-amino-6-(5-phosphoribosylamino)uracil reductase RibD, partial [Rhodospirillales bacterium]|nr:bifunctional diaminohydroxyphosphoribosylaminopyrimidine deaminase/5-amino-6-(5-phosphoribosylamino)uracil reductase RibD [Rhodospirillales bacterium]